MRGYQRNLKVSVDAHAEEPPCQERHSPYGLIISENEKKQGFQAFTTACRDFCPVMGVGRGLPGGVFKSSIILPYMALQGRKMPKSTNFGVNEVFYMHFIYR